MSDRPILVVAAEEGRRETLMAALGTPGQEVVPLPSGKAALEHAGRSPEPLAIIYDGGVVERANLAVLRELRAAFPSRPIIALAIEDSISAAVAAMRSGATDVLPHGAASGELRRSLDSALAKMDGANVERSGRRARGVVTFDSLIGQSPAMKRAVEMARKGAASNVPILIEGESGVGKEMFARAIQQASDRANKPFVAVNCGAIPENLVESILFGHEKGAFTGATERHDGKFVEANGGTLFLDEIGELSLDVQVKLLRAIQEGEVDPVGGRAPVKVDIRLISATNKTLIERVGEGRFREDLLYRLNVFPIRIPPLRERREDILILANHFAQSLAEAEGRPIRPLSAAAADLLVNYDWPGNVRQLENALFRAIILSDGDELQPEDFPQIRNGLGPARLREAGRAASGVAGERAVIEPWDAEGHMRSLAEIEGEVIRLALERYQGHMSEVARRLGIGRSTLYRKVEELGLNSFPRAINGGKS